MAGIGPQLPPHLRALSENNVEETDSPIVGPEFPKELNEQENTTIVKSYGPALPSGYAVNTQSDEPNDDDSDVGIGPALPKGFQRCGDNKVDSDGDSDSDVIGPSLEYKSSEQDDDNVHIKAQFEARAKAMKNKLTGVSNVEEENIERESWMLELPPEIGKNFGLGPRTFRTKATDLGDRSVWTDTPADRERKRKEAPLEQSDKKRKVPTSEELAMKARVEEYNQKTRPQSLLEMHREKYKKADSGVRRPFDRDKDLALHRSNPKEKAKFIEAAKQMNSKFSSGNFEDKFL